MKVEVTVAGKPYRSRAVGETFLVKPIEAKILAKLGRVTYTTKDEVTVEVTPFVPRRRYVRRDMKAE